jgi:hypothetical protein
VHILACRCCLLKYPCLGECIDKNKNLVKIQSIETDDINTEAQ